MLLDVAFENRAISENQSRILAKQREIETALSTRGGKQLFKKKNTAKSDDDDGEQEPELPDFPLKYDEDHIYHYNVLRYICFIVILIYSLNPFIIGNLSVLPRRKRYTFGGHRHYGSYLHQEFGMSFHEFRKNNQERTEGEIKMLFRYQNLQLHCR